MLKKRWVATLSVKRLVRRLTKIQSILDMALDRIPRVVVTQGVTASLFA